MAITVKDVAKRTRLSVHTVRYYAKEGLIPHISRSNSGVRLFEEKDLDWFLLIDCMKKAGMSIKDIKTFSDLYLLGDSTITERLRMLVRQQEETELRLRELQDVLDILKYKRWYYETAQIAGTLNIHAAMKEQDIPEKIRKLREKERKLLKKN